MDAAARAAVEAQADADEAAGEVLRLRRLTRDAGLTPLDVELLLVSLLPDLDTRFERLYGYLNDDVTRRRASVALALELAGASPMVPRPRGPGWSRAGRCCGTACWSSTTRTGRC